MADPKQPRSIRDFAAFLKGEGLYLGAEDLADAFWLAHQIGPAQVQKTPTEEETGDTDNDVEVRRSDKVVTQSPQQERKNPPPIAVTPPTEEQRTDRGAGLGGNLPVQVPAANALRSQLELARALRPLMRKIPSPTQVLLDEEATAVRKAEQGVVSPVLVPAPERWFDLAIVVEDSPSLGIWEDTIKELQALVERQGAFRQVRTWLLQARGQKDFEVGSNWSRARGAKGKNFRQARVLSDPTRRQIIWLVSDCTSDAWDRAAIYELLRDWGRYSPLAILQLFPERLWSRTALGMGTPMWFRACGAGAPQAEVAARATPVYPSFFEEEDEAEEQQDRVAFPVISIEPEPVKRWSNVTAGKPDFRVVGFEIDLESLEQPEPETNGNGSAPSAEQRVRRFCATASITSQKLAGLMAAVPVSLPVVHLIQETMLPQSRQVHVAEVFMGGLMEAVKGKPEQPTQYRFIEEVREQLIDAVPISRTTRVLDTVSAYVSERLGLGTKSFSALIVALPDLTKEQKEAVQPFAEIAIGTLKRLGGEYRAMAERLAERIAPVPPVVDSKDWPPFQEHKFVVAEVELEPLQRFEFETATIAERQLGGIQRVLSRAVSRLRWTITKSPGYGWQRVEDLGQGVALEMVEILGGSFQMGSGSEQHEVEIADFFIGKYPITQAQWRAVAALPEVERSLEADPSDFKGDNRPVENVSWEDAVEFCARLTAKAELTYRLPSEAEWEYACRAGTTTEFHFGETLTPDLANYDGSETYNGGPRGKYRTETTPVGEFPANAFGLYDMHGNVWEWCQDHYHSDYEGAPTDGSAWVSGGDSSRRMLRGGSWNDLPGYCRSAIRSRSYPVARSYGLGFRVVSEAARAQPSSSAL